MNRLFAIYIKLIAVAVIVIGCGSDPSERLQYETLSFPVSDDIVDLHFTGGDEGYVATASQVFFTDDAGGSFNSVYSSDGREIGGVYFVEDDLGFIFGDAGLLARSEDGGSNWQNVSVDNNYRLTDISVIGDGRLQAVGTVVSDTVPAPAIMGSSSDEGITWNFSGVPYHGFKAIETATETHSWVLGSDAIMYTTDGGRTWEHNAARAELEINDFSFSDVAHGWEVSEAGQVRYTDDGGWSWEIRVTLPDSANTRALKAVDAPETDIIYIAGDRLIAMSPNHGLNWYMDDVTPTSTMNAIHAVGGKVYIGGNGGALLRLKY